MKLNRSSVALGAILIVLGLFLFVKGESSLNTGSIFAYFWPTLFVIPLGIFFHWLYFTALQRRGVGVLVPGGILLVAGIVCQIAMLFDIWDVMWPGFPFAVAVGLLELYWFGNRNRWLLIPINILTVLSLLFFFIFAVGNVLGSLSKYQSVLAAILIIAGVVILFVRKKTAD